MAKTYTVFVDDNFHYMDESERYKLGEFPDCASAVAACKQIVDEFFEEEAAFRNLLCIVDLQFAIIFLEHRPARWFEENNRRSRLLRR